MPLDKFLNNFNYAKKILFDDHSERITRLAKVYKENKYESRINMLYLQIL